MTPEQEYTVKVMLDDITFMLFDLERGGFISQKDIFDISDAFKIDYHRELIEEILHPNRTDIISDFFISVSYYDREAIKFIVRGGLRKFTVIEFDGFVAGMVLNELEKYRKAKFSINN